MSTHFNELVLGIVIAGSVAFPLAKRYSSVVLLVISNEDIAQLLTSKVLSDVRFVKTGVVVLAFLASIRVSRLGKFRFVSVSSDVFWPVLVTSRYFKFVCAVNPEDHPFNGLFF